MISLIVPTRNREYTLRVVAESFYNVRLVDEIVFVIDASTDGTEAYLRVLASRYPEVATRLLINERRRGAAYNRQVGAAAARNEYVLYCDDDQFMEANYGEVCLGKLRASGAGAVAGRHVFREPGEPPAAAIARFGNGLSFRRPFKYSVCEFSDDAVYLGDLKLPLANSCILTRRDLVLRYRFDQHYDRGNGYREESDFQMNLFVHGFDIVVTNDAHTVHLHFSETRRGGQRTSRLRRIWWACHYTAYFYAKYWDGYAARVGLRIGRRHALALFVPYMIYTQFVRPLRRIIPWSRRARWHRPEAEQPMLAAARPG